MLRSRYSLHPSARHKSVTKNRSAIFLYVEAGMGVAVVPQTVIDAYQNLSTPLRPVKQRCIFCMAAAWRTENQSHLRPLLLAEFEKSTDHCSSCINDWCRMYNGSKHSGSPKDPKTPPDAARSVSASGGVLSIVCFPGKRKRMLMLFGGQRAFRLFRMHGSITFLLSPAPVRSRRQYG